MSSAQQPLQLQLAHSPDPDDAFMWWPLFSIDGEPPRLDTGRFRFRQVTADIQELNEQAERAAYAITATSCAQYPRVKKRYAITACGCSMGERYGPKLIAPNVTTLDVLRRDNPHIAVPGRNTTAFTTLQMMFAGRRFTATVLPFRDIIPAVVDDDRFDAGLVIHEGQLTYEASGLHLVEDLGKWWDRQHGLPLPLGVNLIRRDIDGGDPQTLAEISALLRRSVAYALDHRDESVAYAMQFAGGVDEQTADRFITMYVNAWTLDFGSRGRKAVRLFLQAANEMGLLPTPEPLDFI